MRVEFLWFDGCPNHETARRVLNETMQELGLGEVVEVIQVESIEAAEVYRFQGSPSIRIDGVDVDPVPVTEMPYGMACRVYLTPDGPQGWPMKETIRAALVAAQSEATRQSG